MHLNKYLTYIRFGTSFSSGQVLLLHKIKFLGRCKLDHQEPKFVQQSTKLPKKKEKQNTKLGIIPLTSLLFVKYFKHYYKS